MGRIARTHGTHALRLARCSRADLHRVPRLRRAAPGGATGAVRVPCHRAGVDQSLAGDAAGRGRRDHPVGAPNPQGLGIYENL